MDIHPESIVVPKAKETTCAKSTLVTLQQNPMREQLNFAEIQPSSITITACVVLVVSAYVHISWSSRRGKGSSAQDHHEYDVIPLAKGGIPLLGHALAYKHDPPSFICEQEKMIGGPIFRINLAGRKMVIIGGTSPEIMRQVATLPSSIMSSEKAVADIGFEHTLGKINVFKGTAWHKRILKDEVTSVSKFESTFLPAIREEFKQSMEREIKNQTSRDHKGDNGEEVFIPDLFTFVRRCVLRCMMNVMVGLSIDNAAEEEEMLDEFMIFQDSVEDATAKAAVMSSILAYTLVLRPVERRRKKLEASIAAHIETTWKKQTPSLMAPWLRKFYEERISSEEAATLVVGLMFAAHKNLAIAAAQCLCFLHSHSEGNEGDLKQVQEEAKILMQRSECTIETLLQARTLRCYILETLRVTSHTIGAIRKVCKDTVVRNGSRAYILKKGETVAISHIATHRNENIWCGGDASDFNPHREHWKSATSACFTTTGAAAFDNPIDNYKMTTFSHGIYKCPGQRLASSLIEIIVASFINMKVCFPGPMPNVSFERATLAQRSGKVPIKCTLP